MLTFDTAIEKLLNEKPQCIPVFIKYRMGCVGCAMASFDTIADVIRIYNLPQEAFLEDLQAALASSPTDD